MQQVYKISQQQYQIIQRPKAAYTDLQHHSENLHKEIKSLKKKKKIYQEHRNNKIKSCPMTSACIRV